MPTFRQRPLTWLFVIATIVVDVAAWAQGRYEAEWVQGLILGQLMALGGWLALGRTHPLLRVTAAIVAIVATIAPDLMAARFIPMVVSYALTQSIVIAAATAVFSLVWRLALERFEPQEIAGAPRRWRLSVLELLGWMTVVGVATTVLKRTDRSAVTEAGDLVEVAFVVALAALVMTLWLRDELLSVRKRLIASIALVVFLVVGFKVSPTPRDSLVLIPPYGYLAAWIAVQRMDEARLRKLSPKGAPIA